MKTVEVTEIAGVQAQGNLSQRAQRGSRPDRSFRRTLLAVDWHCRTCEASRSGKRHRPRRLQPRAVRNVYSDCAELPAERRVRRRAPAGHCAHVAGSRRIRNSRDHARTFAGGRHGKEGPGRRFRRGIRKESCTIAWRDWDTSSGFAEKVDTSAGRQTREGHDFSRAAKAQWECGFSRCGSLCRAIFWRNDAEKVLLSLWIAVFLVPAFAQQEAIHHSTESRWWEHIKVLAADNMEGRDTGSRGTEKSGSLRGRSIEGCGASARGRERATTSR